MNCDKNDLLLYAVTDRHWLDGRRLIDVVRESLDGGVTMVQLREKTLEEGKFLEEAKELQTLCPVPLRRISRRAMTLTRRWSAQRRTSPARWPLCLTSAAAPAR